MENKQVAICLATYGNNPFLVEQLDSLKRQTWQNFTIYWAHDDSNLVVKEQIRNLLQGFAFVEIINKSSKGFSENFMNLLRHTTEPFIAFCDHDDVWIDQKIEHQIRSLLPLSDKPALTHCQSIELKSDKLRRKQTTCRHHHRIGNLIAENCAKGCTIMLNGKAREMIIRAPKEKIIWHDWWCVSVIAATGVVVSSPEALVHYRIHKNNSIGNPSVARRIGNFYHRPTGTVINQFKIILNLYANEIWQSEKKDLENVLRIFDVPFYKRCFMLIIDTRRRKSLVSDIVRRVLWSLKTP